MADAKHTPGPWCVIPAGKAQSRWIVGDAEGGSIADFEPAGPWMSPEEADANAHLGAAAPDMRAALEAIAARVNGEWDHPALVAVGPLGALGDDCLRIVRAAIAKAEGRSHDAG